MNNNLVQGIYSIKDMKAECFLPIFTFRTNGEAIRAFDDSIQKGDTPLSNHPEDFCLYKIGEFDQFNGVIIPVEHTSLGCAADFVKKDK